MGNTSIPHSLFSPIMALYYKKFTFGGSKFE